MPSKTPLALLVSRMLLDHGQLVICQGSQVLLHTASLQQVSPSLCCSLGYSSPGAGPRIWPFGHGPLFPSTQLSSLSKVQLSGRISFRGTSCSSWFHVLSKIAEGTLCRLSWGYIKWIPVGELTSVRWPHSRLTEISVLLGYPKHCCTTPAQISLRGTDRK